MEDSEIVLPNEVYDVEEGPLEESLQSPRFYNLTVEETQDLQVSSYNDRSRIVFSPGGDEAYLVAGSDDARSLATDSTPRSNVSTVSDYVAEKFSKFADSLMRQRQQQQLNRSSVIKGRAVESQAEKLQNASSQHERLVQVSLLVRKFMGNYFLNIFFRSRSRRRFSTRCW